MNLTLIAHQEGNSYHDRCGDHYSHDGSLTIDYCKTEQEVIDLWSKYLFKNLNDRVEAEQEYQITLLFDGKPYYEYEDLKYDEYEGIHDGIKELASGKINDHLAEKKRLADAAALLKKAREDEQRRLAEVAKEKAERAQYEVLRAKFGGK